ncbi:MAG: cobalamin-binding protein, partial [Flammeovirgaceae bacterium]|nr:cobalamin-binding protein [Flammeovirgaceae bacterium]
MTDYFPKRIVCLTEEPTEILYALGEQDRIVGISGFTVRPKEARLQKPKVSTFLEANIDEILSLNPDLVIGYSDLQANIARDLIAKGVSVFISNHRSVEEILRYIVQVGSWVGKAPQASAWAMQIKKKFQERQTQIGGWSFQPTVYFEEWYDPIITSIQWVSELIELAGGKYIFKELSTKSLAKDRIVADADEIVRRNPDIILVSWCGKKFKKEKMLSRRGWEQISAVRNQQIFEIPSSIILQPGPAALTEGFAILSRLID